MNEEIRKNEEIREDELENVSGGRKAIPIPVDGYFCPSCGGWLKEEMNGKNIHKKCCSCGYEISFSRLC